MVEVVSLDEVAIMALLADVPDPEIPAVSVLDLGIVRGLRADPLTVLVTPTYTGCPATIAIEQAIRAALDAAGFNGVAIQTILSPPWSTEWITPAGHSKLKAYGIAPPTTALTAQCPQCNSHDTLEVSRFGSTPCKSLWRCRDCAEPFDRFKCH
jgi:ring-1,2-phenylacetyl-CoA epoxidase subunit PaaD